MNCMHCVVAMVVAASFVRAEAADKTHPFSVRDMLAMQRIGEPSVSPNGRRIVFSLRTTDLKADRGRTDLWLIDIDGTHLRRLTADPANDSNPCWNADGNEILFLSTRSGSSQVWRIATDGGEAEQVTDLPLEVSNLIVSTSSRLVAFTLDVFPDCGIAETRKRLDSEAQRQSTGRLYDHVFVRHWDTWKDGRRSHVFVLPSNGHGQPVDVMRSMDADCPSKPFGSADEFCFTPDETAIVLTTRHVGRIEPWSTDFDLYVAPIDGAAVPRCLTDANEAWDCCPSFSPDGKTMAYLAMRRPGYESDRMRIVLMDWPHGRPHVLTEDWDRSPSSLCWSAGGKTLYATAANLGQRSLFAIDAKTGKAKELLHDGNIGSVSLAGTRIVFSRSDLKQPAELFSVENDGSDLREVTQINAARVAAARTGDYQQFTFKGFQDETVYCYVVKPIDFDPGKMYPVAFLIHGGPQGSFGNMFHYRWNPQAYAGAGYAAVMVDFHGSVGYGQAFTDSIRGDWGGKPFEDLQKGLAATLKRYPWMDADRVGALGASFGGYMINWVAGNWPDRFRCLVNHDGNLDERAAYYDTEELWFPEWDHIGTPWSNPDGYEKHNPVNYVDQWKTPMLVIHGGHDYRVADAQGLSTFNALQRRGIPSQLLYFPDENHWVQKPHNSIQWHNTVIGWLDRWLKK